MTLPSERVSAVKRAREFMYALLDPKQTPRVPRNIRMMARSVLKHFPADYYLNDIFTPEQKKELKQEMKMFNRTE